MGPATRVLCAGALLAAATARPVAADERGGFFGGFTSGLGVSAGCEQCEMVGGPVLGGHFGFLMMPARLAAVADLTLHTYVEGEASASGVTFLAGIQYWPIRRLWIGAGAGVAEDGHRADAPASAFVVVGQGGVELRRWQRFGLDLRGRYEYLSGGTTSTSFAVGFTWY